MSGNGYHHIDSYERFERRSQMTAWRVNRGGAAPPK